MRRGVFVTGTDTGVGKTLACCALIHALAARGERPYPMKPVAAGAGERDGEAMNADTRLLLEAAGLDARWAARVTPVLLRAAMAPHIAARRESVVIGLGPILDALQGVAADRFLVVEGVGGFRVPLGEALDTVDLARAFALPVVMVVGLRLGCLNHALLTAQAIEAGGMRLAGWIASHIDPHMEGAAENVEALVQRLPGPLLGSLAHAPQPDARALACGLDVGPLL
jgi:dethiobiotin synthetase